MEDTHLQIVEEEIALGREPTTDGHDLEIRDATGIGGLRLRATRTRTRTQGRRRTLGIAATTHNKTS